jgi:3alpha(or 20beta)-hydroxysteroid dehydrogenase
MNNRLQGKVAIITGAARGTGAAIARRFVKEGAKVCVADIEDDVGRRLADELGENAMYQHADVSKAADWAALVEEVVNRFGTVQVLVNNAALLDISLLDDVKEETVVRLFRVNQLGPILGIQAVVPQMRREGFGSIVNIGSIDGVVGQDIGLLAYGSTKFALRGITRIAAMELGRDAIRVNCINPDSGNIAMSKPFLPPDLDPDEAMREHVQQILQPPRWVKGFHRYSEISAMALFLASDESSGSTGGDFAVDGGYTVGRRYR